MKKEIVPTDIGIDGEITYGGSFKGDHEMPLYSTREFDAAFSYLDLLMEIKQARSHNFKHVNVKGEEMPMAKAERNRDHLKREFRNTVAAVAREEDPAVTQADINRRAHDVLASLMDTSYRTELSR